MAHLTKSIIGGIVGGVHEFTNIKTKDFPLFTDEKEFTDDSINRRIGWVSMELNLIISRLMNIGKAFVCRVTETDRKNTWFRITAKISMIE